MPQPRVYLALGSSWSGHASANLYSLIETAQANGIGPYRYLVWLFTPLRLATTADDYAALLSWNMPAKQPLIARQQPSAS